ncbi:MAG: 3-hydroxyacyl-CoA dehydrogenase family protein, partial [Pseudomonadota bacterium]
EERRARGIIPRSFDTAEIQHRFVAAMVNEGARLLSEGIARRPLDIDVVMMTGYGFPRYWGGPMKWADLTGVETLLLQIEDYADEDAYFWTPAELLRDIVRTGRGFDSLNKG